MIRVVLCDDHPIYRQGVKTTLAQYTDITVVAEAASCAELREALQGVRCDVLVLDIALPDGNGLEMMHELGGSPQKPAVIVLSMHAEEQYAIRAIKAGAKGYLAKASIPDELIVALRKVGQGGVYVSPSLAERLALEISGEGSEAAHEKLSNREYQVMRELASGKSIKQIAHDMCLSPSTIATYRARLLEKLHLQTTAELIHYALQNRLVE
jgi:two-component system invasion response regulator UvrY